MATTYLNTAVTTQRAIQANDHLVIGHDGAAVVDGNAGARFFGDGGELTIRGVVIGNDYGVTALTSGGAAVSNVTVRVDDDGLVSGSSGIDMRGGTGYLVQNEGTVSAGAGEWNDYGVNLQGDASTVQNLGSISGGTVGVRMVGSNAALLNDGEITSSMGNGATLSGAKAAVVNNGLIATTSSAANDYGLYVFSDSAAVQNHGTISAAGGDGLYALNAYASPTGTFELLNTGTISGAQVAVRVTDAFNGLTAKIVNAGTMDGDVLFSSAHDLYDGRAGQVFGQVQMGTGNDTAFGGSGSETMSGGSGTDLMEGGGGADLLNGDNGEDTMEGGAGADTLNGGNQADEIDGGEGNDVVSGGTGADILEGGEGIDTLSYTTSAGAVQVNLGTGETLFNDAQGDIVSGFERVLGSQHGDMLIGSNGEDTLHGSGGFDYLAGGWGRDQIRGGAGNDTLDGGAGRNALIGGDGRDSFKFSVLADSGVDGGSRDVIRDFVQGQDVIDLSAIDPSALPGNQAFAFRGNLGFSGNAAEVAFLHSFGNTLVSLDADADGGADMSIMLTGLVTLVATDFVL
jgi:Ca2+-binding RTX toxin-like protein